MAKKKTKTKVAKGSKLNFILKKARSKPLDMVNTDLVLPLKKEFPKSRGLKLLPWEMRGK